MANNLMILSGNITATFIERKEKVISTNLERKKEAMLTN